MRRNMLAIAILALTSLSPIGSAAYADPVQEATPGSPTSASVPPKQNSLPSEKSAAEPQEVVKNKPQDAPRSPQEPLRPSLKNARVREIAEQVDLLWPSAESGLQAKPSGAASAEGVLRKMGQSEDPETRRRAVEGLRALGNGLDGAELLEALQDESPSVREAAATSLVGAPPEVAFAAVLDVLTTGTPEEIACIESVLPRLKVSLEEPMLGVLMNADETLDHRVAAAYSLGRMRGEESLRVLVDLSWSGEPLLAAYSADALAYMGNPSTVLDLVDLLKHSNPDVRYAAVEGLGRIGSPDAVNALSEMVTSDSEDRSHIRQLAVAVLGRIGGSDAVPVLIQAMAAPNMAVREVAGGELRRLTGMNLGSEPGIWEAWYMEEEAARQQALPPEQSANTPPLVPSLPLELPPGVTLNEDEQDAAPEGTK